MAMDVITVLGFIAGALTTISFLPQAIKAFKTKSTKDISLEMFIAFSTGVFLWIVYGLYVNSLPVIIANVTTFIFAVTILFFKVRYK